MNTETSNNNNNNNSILSIDQLKNGQGHGHCEFTLKSPLPPLQLPAHAKDLTISEYLLERAKYWADAGKIYWNIDTQTGEKRKFADFESETASVASWLYKHGMRAGDTMLYMTSKLSSLLFVQMGTWRANGIVRAIYPEEDEETLLSYIIECHVGWILCDLEVAEGCLAAAAKVDWNVDIIIADGGTKQGCTSLSELFKDDAEDLPILTSKPHDVCVIFCTSGTTGRSKGAAHSHQSVLTQIEQLSKFVWCEHKPNLTLSKATHASGLLTPFGLLVAGHTALVLSVPSKENVFKAVQDYKPGGIFGFAPFLTCLVNDPDAKQYDFSSIEYFGTTGAAVSSTVEEALMTLPNVKVVITIYGLTEVGGLITNLDFESEEKWRKIPGSPPLSSGKALPGVSIQIHDIDTGLPLGPNQRGQICIKSDGVFHSYHGNNEATESAYTGNGWFKTGDVGLYDEDGFLFIVDRLKDTFKYYGNHISPTEIEEAILKHPHVSSVCVIGVKDPDGGDHFPRGFVTLKPGVVVDECGPEEIKSFVHDLLPDYKHLRGGLFILDELPRGKTGKISRQLAAQLKV